jgi:homoserine dehydrogenase
MSIPLILTGYGNVGKAFVRLLAEKRDDCLTRYGLEFDLIAVFRRSGGWVARTAGEFPALVGDPSIPLEAHPGWTPGLTFDGFFEHAPKSGVLVECTPSNWRTGEPQLAYLHSALDRGWSIASASKGALVVDFINLRAKARAKHLALKFSGATAAALPTLDVATISLAGAKILGFEGILTGTTNYILTRLGEGLSFETALREAQDKGIAEPDPSMDIDGWDTACKLLLIANAAAGTEFTLDDIQVEGIRGVTAEAIRAAREEGQALKLFGRLNEIDGRYVADVKPIAVPSSHPLYRLTGTSKGIVFRTDTMGTVAVTDGKSDPRGTAAAVLKDVINIHRDR